MHRVGSRLEQCFGDSLGVALTVGVHAIVLMFLLSSRVEEQTVPEPLITRIVSDVSKEKHERVVLSAEPTLARPGIHVPQPEIQFADVPKAVTASAATPASQQSTSSHQYVEALPRFDADYLNNPQPHYPQLSRRMREEGVVTLRVLVLSTGLPDVIELKSSSGSIRLDQSAIAAVRKWKFVPAQRAGRTVEAWVIIPIEFTLNTYASR